MVVRLHKLLTVKVSNKMLEDLDYLTQGKDRSEFVRIAIEDRIKYELRKLRRDVKREDKKEETITLITEEEVL